MAHAKLSDHGRSTTKNNFLNVCFTENKIIYSCITRIPGLCDPSLRKEVEFVTIVHGVALIL